MEYVAYVTIGIPVRIDSPERKRNLDILLRHVTSSGVNVHVLEAGERRGYFPVREDNGVTYSYVYDESAVYHKTVYVNSLLKQATTPVVAIWDADIIFPLSQLELSAQAIMEQDYALSIPYNGVVKMLSDKQSKAFEQSGQGCEYLAMQGYTHLMKRPSCGGYLW